MSTVQRTTKNRHSITVPKSITRRTVIPSIRDYPWIILIRMICKLSKHTKIAENLAEEDLRDLMAVNSGKGIAPIRKDKGWRIIINLNLSANPMNREKSKKPWNRNAHLRRSLRGLINLNRGNLIIGGIVAGGYWIEEICSLRLLLLIRFPDWLTRPHRLPVTMITPGQP